MGLFVRMSLYLVFGGLAGMEFGTFNDATGDYTVNVEDVKGVLMSLFGFVGTFVWSRIAKARGGTT